MTYKGAIKQLYEMRDNTLMPEFFKPYFDKIIETLTDDVRENVRGEWIDRGKNMTIRWQCSECGRRDTHIYNFCPNCGAEMRSISALSENVEIASNLKRGES